MSRISTRAKPSKSGCMIACRVVNAWCQQSEGMLALQPKLRSGCESHMIMPAYRHALRLLGCMQLNGHQYTSRTGVVDDMISG